MTLLEPGCGMGYFSLPMARLVGPDGRVICVDVQPRMIEGLRRRARRTGLLDRIEARVCTSGDLGLSPWSGRIDLAVAIHTIHEVGDEGAFLGQVAAALRPGGTLLILEPRGHVGREAFEATLDTAAGVGLYEKDRPAVRRKLAAVLVNEGRAVPAP